MHTQPIAQQLRGAHRMMKSIAAVVLVAFLNLSLHPLAVAASLPAATKPTVRAETNDDQLENTLTRVAKRLDSLDEKTTRHAAIDTDKADLRTLRNNLEQLDTDALQNFATIAQQIDAKKLPSVIRERHVQMVKNYQREMRILKQNLVAVEDATDDNARHTKLQQAIDHLRSKQKKHSAPSFDPNDLPSKALKPDRTRKPRETKDSYVHAGIFNNPYVKLASHGTFRIDQLPGASDPAYLAATTEVSLTPAIRAKAAELAHNPVQIYQWVRNNVEWIPTWGATQDADVTLGSRRGNDADIASLLIALLRASDIPARYVHGTVELPTKDFINWVGGFTNLDAALNYASMGGIPTTSVTRGGVISSVRIEHIWVEAAIDFYPSRGSANKSADRWVALDASFKQYQDLKGLDVATIAGIDPKALAQSFVNSGTVNDTEGWVSGLNPTVLQNAQAQAQTALTQYIQKNLTNPTVGDVIGGRRIIQTSYRGLPASLPYRTITIGARYGSLPQAIQNRMTLAFGTDVLGDPVDPVTFPWARLNNHKVTLSFKPATAADEQALASLLPPGPITNPSQLPSSIPAYLIAVIPQLAIDGTVVAQGQSMTLGQELTFYYGLSRATGEVQSYTYPVIAGSYLSVAVAGGGVSASSLQNLRARLDQTNATLNSGNNGLVSTLNREDVLGDLFYAGALGYFGEYIALAQASSLANQARHNLPYAYGTIGYEPEVQSFFGIPKGIRAGGVAVNVRLGWTNQPLDGDISKWRNLNRQNGTLASSLENGILEQMFSSPAKTTQGVSAVSVMALATQQGQRIYHITPQNQNQTLPNLHLGGLAMSEIQKGLATGKDVIAHTDAINVSGWVGEGYMILDPDTGSGAYKITGGLNGGFLTDAFTNVAATLLNAIVGPAYAGSGSLGNAGEVLGFLNDLADVIKSCYNSGHIVHAIVAITLLTIFTLVVAEIVVAFSVQGALLTSAFAFFVGWWLMKVFTDALKQNLGCQTSWRQRIQNRYLSLISRFTMVL